MLSRRKERSVLSSDLSKLLCCDSAKRLKQIAAKQAEDETIWFIAETSTEAYLQQVIRELHEAIEREFGATY